MSPHDPKVSIITICRNAVDEIGSTMGSVLGQSYSAIEYLIIDGGSTDGTVEQINRHAKPAVKWISEPDRGIYDAMNKGVRLATADWTIFMNAGDRFYAPDSLSQLLARPISEADVVYGDHEVRYGEDFSRIQHARGIETLWKGMICSHQAMICRTQLLREHPFGDGSLAEDFSFLMHLKACDRRFEYRPVVVASVAAGGLSDTRRAEFLRDRLRTVTRYESGFAVHAYYAGLIAQNQLIQVVRKGIPRHAWRWLLASKYGLAKVSKAKSGRK